MAWRLDGFFGQAVEQVQDRQPGMGKQHTRTSKAHHPPDLFAAVMRIAMHRAAGAGGFALLKRAFL